VIVQADFILIGHTRQQFVKRVGQKTVVNPGSLRQPKSLGPVACYAIWEDGQVELKRIPYPCKRRQSFSSSTKSTISASESRKSRMRLVRGWSPTASPPRS
jgi:hypothetical protein